MSYLKRSRCASTLLVVFSMLLIWLPVLQADQKNWHKEKVDWRASGGVNIKSINYPPGKRPSTLKDRTTDRKAKPRKIKVDAAKLNAHGKSIQQLGATSVVYTNLIESPPADGFVPWIAVTATNKSLGDFDLDAEPHPSIQGSFLAGRTINDYTIGLFDTGAGANVMGNAAANQLGLFAASKITSNLIQISGVNDSVEVWVSQPIGLFIDGLGTLEPNGVIIDSSGFIGESNVSIVVGQTPQGNAPDLPTAIGSPLAVYFAADVRNDTLVSRVLNSEHLVAPDIQFFELDDPQIPVYPNTIPLELRPLGSFAVQYTPCVELFGGCIGDGVPSSPSIVLGTSAQSLFFVSSVDLYDGSKSAIDKDRFMFDTGAQVTVIGSRVGARLSLDPANPDFTVDIQGVTGQITVKPGFFIDALDIPALGEWLSFTNIPVILLDVASPEGGTLDGIIGMNLFVQTNFLFRGGGLGGLVNQDDPAILFEIIPESLRADIAPIGGDDSVNTLDLMTMMDAWLTTPIEQSWNTDADIAPFGTPDSIVNILDFSILCSEWMMTITL